MGTGGLDIFHWLRGSGVDHDRLWALNERANSTVRWGHQLHVAAAIATCLAIALPMSFLEISAGILAAMLVLRLPATWRLYPALFTQPVMLAGGAFFLIQVLGLLWSPDPGDGLDDIDSMRWALLIPALWPLRHLRGWFIFCVILSFIAANVCQLVQALAFEFGWEHLDFDAYPDRISGWLSPASGGSVLLAAYGLHLGASLLPRHPLRWPARGLALVSLLAVFATGARGAWIGAGLLTCVAVFGMLMGTRSRMRVVLGALAIGLAGMVAGWLVLGDEIESRVDEAQREIEGALEAGDYATSTGARINMWIWGWRAFSDHPVLGVGTGGYQAWVQNEQVAQGIDPAQQPIASHAHGQYVHLAATHGVVGLAGFALVVLTALVLSAPGAHEGRTYQAGLFLGIIAMLCAGVFDTVTINSQTAAVFWLFIALSVRPSNGPDEW